MDSIGRRIMPPAVVALVSAVVMLTNLGGPRLWDRDEPRNAGCAREMLQRGDWIVPVFNGELRGHKPVLLYWCIMAAYEVLGVSELAARLPSALCAIGSTICTSLIGRRLYGPGASVWAGIVLSSSLLFVMVGRAATPDSLLIFCMTLAMTIYVRGTNIFVADGVRHGWFPQNRTTVMAMYAAMSLAALAKGPVGVLLPCAIIGLFLLTVRLPAAVPRSSRAGTLAHALVRPFAPGHFLATLWLMRPITLLLVVTLVAVPWYWAVGSATGGEFLRVFLLEHNFGRATTVMEGHRGNVLFYPATILVGFFPWSVFAVPLILDLAGRMRRRENRHPGHVLAVCWIGVTVVMFSLARTKLPSYIAPCFPALALLTGHYIDCWCRRQPAPGRWLEVSFGCYALVGVIVAGAVPFAARRYLPGEEWLGLIGCVPLLAGVLCLKWIARQRLRRAATLFAGSAVAFTMLIFTVGAQRADRHQQSQVLFRAIGTHSSDPHIASYGVLEPSWVFYCGRPITELPQSAPVPGAEQVVRFLESESESFVIATEEHARELERLLPPGIVVLAEADRFLSTQKLMLLGRTGSRSVDLSPRARATPPAGSRAAWTQVHATDSAPGQRF